MLKRMLSVLLVFLLLGLSVFTAAAEEACVLLVTRVYEDPASGTILLEACTGSVSTAGDGGIVLAGFDVKKPVLFSMAENAVIWLPQNLSGPSAQICVTTPELLRWYLAAGDYLTAMNTPGAFFAAVTLENNATVTMLTLCSFE